MTMPALKFWALVTRGSESHFRVPHGNTCVSTSSGETKRLPVSAITYSLSCPRDDQTRVDVDCLKELIEIELLVDRVRLACIARAEDDSRRLAEIVQQTRVGA